MEDAAPSSEKEQHERRHLFRHRLLFVLGFLAMFVGAISYRSWLGALGCATAAACFAVSGASAIAARRHLFGGMGGAAWGYVYMRDAPRGRAGATVAGVVLFALAGGLAAAALWIALSRS